MKTKLKKIILLIMIIFSYTLQAQVGIGTTTPDVSAELDITSSDKGILIPRVSLSNVNNTTTPINNPTSGLLVYNTNIAVTGGNGVGFYYFNGTLWEQIVSKSIDDIGTDNQNLTGAVLTDSDLTISIENGTGISADLSGLKDADWYKVGSNTQPNSINDNIFTYGNVGIGGNIPSKRLHVFGPNQNLTLAATIENGNAGSGLGIELSGNKSTYGGVLYNLKLLQETTSTDSVNKVGIYSQFSGGGQGNLTCVRNWVTNTASYLGYVIGVYNLIFNNTGISNYGVYNYIKGTGTGSKYGTYTLIPNTEGGIHYGFYSDVQKTSGYAGYFIGKMSLGNTTSNRYLMPSSDGASNYIMQTNGAGQVSFVDPITIGDGTGTDDQNITGSGLSGTSLTIGIENGLSEVVDLSSLQDGGALIIDDLNDAKSDSDGSQDGSSVFLGINAGSADDSTDNQNVGVGFEVLKFTTTGSFNTAVGYKSLYLNLTGYENTAYGNASLYSNTTGYENVAMGNHSLYNNTTGFYNIATGNYSLSSNTTGIQNVAIGDSALFSNKANNGTVAIGYEAMVYADNRTTGRQTYNTAIGYQALRGGLIANVNTGQYNTAVGYHALRSNTTGSENVVIGNSSLFANTTGNGNVAFGSEAGHLNDVGNKNVFIGYQSGYNETTSNKLYLENSNANADNALIYGEFDNNILRINGELQLGSTAATRYAMPSADGSSNQVLKTNGSGQVIWSTLPDESNSNEYQNLSGSLTANILEIAINNGTNASVDLSDLVDADWYETGNTAPNDITDDIFTSGKVGIGDNIPDTSLEINGGLTLTPGAVINLVADTTATVGDRSVLVVSNTLGTTFILTLTNGLATGQLLYIVATGTTISSIGLKDLGNNALSGPINLNANDSLSLIWNGTHWVQVSFSDN